MPAPPARRSIIALLLGGILTGGAAADVPRAALPVGTSTEEVLGTMIRNARWRISQIPVCWEDAATPADAPYRAITRRAVAETWEAHSPLRFTGWGQCGRVGQPGIRIAVRDEGPHVKRLGRLGSGQRHGMVLNFTFHVDKWTDCSEPAAQREHCAYVAAAHEFGHAIGFTHEQNREDAPKQCRDEQRQGSVGDYNVTIYDPHSIMNYCNTKWMGDGKLSPLDVEAVQIVYGVPA